MDQNQLKKLVGEKSVEFVKDNMILGLGTGTTVKYMVDALGKRVQEEGLHVTGVTTSERTAQQAKSLGIPLKSVQIFKESRVAVLHCFLKRSLRSIPIK